MNERIKQLQKQAWDYAMAVHDGHIVPPLDKEVWPIDKVLDEKFAELIVKECMMLVEGFESTQEVALDEYIDYEASAVLKEHFGVKE